MKTTTHNSQFMKRVHALARSIQSAYSNYTAAYSTAYRLIYGKVNKTTILDAMKRAINDMQKLGLYNRMKALQTAWFAIYNLDYLDY